MPFVGILYGWHGKMAWRGVWRSFGVPSSWGWGLGLRHSPAGIWPPAVPPFKGLGLRHSLIRRDLASLHSAFPTPLPRGPWHNNRKKLKRAPARPSWFLYTVIPYASKLVTVCQCTKKALKRCLRAFSRCCGERGIRTPGTVTRTSV